MGFDELNDYQVEAYNNIIKRHPAANRVSVVEYVMAEDYPGSYEQFVCRHKWHYTGTSYGGDDPRWCGEGRCYCVYCGMDGDG
jgi:hypothetical protein